MTEPLILTPFEECIGKVLNVQEIDNLINITLEITKNKIVSIEVVDKAMSITPGMIIGILRSNKECLVRIM